MTLKELLARYEQTQEFKAFAEKFPRMYDFSKHVQIIEWSEEYAVADCNPEVVDTVEFYNMLLENGLIT